LKASELQDVLREQCNDLQCDAKIKKKYYLFASASAAHLPTMLGHFVIQNLFHSIATYLYDKKKFSICLHGKITNM
jgi:hypothetical protein